VVDSTLAFDVFARDDGASAVFDKVARAADKTGTALKKTSKISDDVAKASANLTKAHNAESDALDKVQVAEARLADVRGNSKAKTGQVIAAEKALAKARRDAAVSGEVALKAAKELGSALDNESKKAGKGLLGSLKKSFDLGGGSVFKQIGTNAGNGILGGITGALKTPVIGPALIAGVGGALAVALPVVGEIAGAGIVAGFGVGLGALGIVFAAKTVAVRNAWNKSLWSMAADMKIISKPFESTLVSMAGFASRTFKSLSPDLAASFKALAPAFTSFGDQLGHSFARLGPALVPLSTATAAVLKSLGGALPDLIGKLSSQLIDLSASVERNPAGLKDLASGLIGVTDGALKTIKVLNDVDSVLKKIPGGFGFFSGLPGKLDPVKGSIDAIFTAISNLDNLLAGSSANSQQLADIVGKSGAAVSAYGQAAAGAAGGLDKQAGAAARSAHETHAANAAAALAAGAYDRQAAATDKLVGSLNKLSGLLLTLSGAQIGYQQAVDDATQAVKDNGKTHDINTQKGRDNKTALDQVAASAIAQRDAMLKANDGNMSAAKSALSSRGAYEKLAQQMGFSIPVAKAMAAQLIALPPVKRVDVTANIKDLQGKLATAQTALKSPHLTATKKSKLEATISNLTSGIATSKALLASLPQSRTAKLQANKADLEAKIKSAQALLASPKLSATKKATLTANIANAKAGIATINGMLAGLPKSKSTTLTTNIVTKYTTVGSRSSGSGVGGGHLAPVAPGRAVGGPVKAGQPYMVGEKGPELWTPKTDGTIIPNNALKTGQSVASGLAQGMLGGAGSAISAAGQVAAQMIAKARDVLGIASPSKAFAQLGLYINQGFKIGLLGSSKSVQSVMSSLMSKVLNIAFNAADTKKAIQKTIASYNTAIAAARKKIKPVTSGMSNSEAAKTERNNAAAAASIKALRAKLAGAKIDLANVQAIASRLGTTVKRNAVIGMLQRENVAMQKLANARAVVANQLKAAQTKLASAIQVRDEFKKSITDAAMTFNSIANIQPPDGGQLTASGIIAQMSETLRKTQAFAANLARLKKSGLNSTTYEQIASAGVDQGGSIADALLSGGGNTFNSINRLQANINSAATGLGSTAAANMYQAGVDAAQGLVNGLLAKTKALDAASQKLANAIVAQIKKTLGIHSPSTVLEWHGSMAGKGFAKGVEGEYGRVMKAGAGLGTSVLPGSRPRRAAVPANGVRGGGGIYITVNGALDPNAVALQIQQLLNRYGRTGGVSVSR